MSGSDEEGQRYSRKSESIQVHGLPDMDSSPVSWKGSSYQELAKNGQELRGLVDPEQMSRTIDLPSEGSGIRSAIIRFFHIFGRLRLVPIR